jgi:hypothetical protein
MQYPSRDDEAGGQRTLSAFFASYKALAAPLLTTEADYYQNINLEIE